MAAGQLPLNAAMTRLRQWLVAFGMRSWLQRAVTSAFAFDLLLVLLLRGQRARANLCLLANPFGSTRRFLR